MIRSQLKENKKKENDGSRDWRVFLGMNMECKKTIDDFGGGFWNSLIFQMNKHSFIVYCDSNFEMLTNQIHIIWIIWFAYVQKSKPWEFKDEEEDELAFLHLKSSAKLTYVIITCHLMPPYYRTNDLENLQKKLTIWSTAACFLKYKMYVHEFRRLGSKILQT